MASDLSYIEHKQKIREEHLPFDVEAWYPLLEEITFFTAFIDLTTDHAQAIRSFYAARYNSRRESFSSAHAVALYELRKALDAILRRPEFEEKGAFVRLSSRSPKDGSPFRQVEFQSKYQDILARLNDAEGEETASSPENNQMRALATSSSNCWRVFSGDDAMSLILSSERVFVDVIEALVCQESHPDALEKPKPWTMKISGRAWEEDLQDQFEFRCFVRNAAVTAMSQYNHYCMFPALLAAHSQTQKEVANFCEKEVCPRLAGNKNYEEGYVVDVGLMSGRCVVIEVNPFKNSTGAALFDWKHDMRLISGLGSETGLSENKEQQVQDCMQVECPPLRIRVVPMPGLAELMDVLLDEAQIATHNKESYLDVLMSLELEARQREGSGELISRRACICQ
eukprot:gene26367-32340_t